MPEAERGPSPGPRTIMAFDFGTKRIGIAVGNTLARLATPLATVPGNDPLPALQTHVDAWQPDLFVIGEPRHADGAPHPTARAARRFARGLTERYARPCQLLDERLSSHAASARLDSAGRATRALGIDAMAAAVILETYFNGLGAGQ